MSYAASKEACVRVQLLWWRHLTVMTFHGGRGGCSWAFIVLDGVGIAEWRGVIV